MNKYESIIIIKPNENKEEINKTLDKFKKQIESFSNKNVNMEDLGEKRLAYEIQGNQKGYYALFKFYAKPESISELERNYRIDDNILKFITVRQEVEELEETEDEEEAL